MHAIDFMVYAHLQHGAGPRGAAARSQTRARVAEGGRPDRAAHADGRGAGHVQTAYAAIPARYAIERGAWKEATQLELHALSPAADAITHFTRAMGFMPLRDAEERAHRDRGDRGCLRDELTKRDDAYWSEQVDIQRLAATAWVALLEGKAPRP